MPRSPKPKPKDLEVQLQIRISKATRQALRQAAFNQDRTFSAVARRALDDYVAALRQETELTANAAEPKAEVDPVARRKAPARRKAKPAAGAGRKASAKGARTPPATAGAAAS